VTTRSGYREWAPPAALRTAIACLWTRTSPGDRDDTALILPDGCVDMVWQRGRGAFIAGADTGPVATLLSGDAVIVGVRFRPGAAGNALGVQMHELRDRRVDIGELHNDLDGRLSAGLSPPAALAQIAGTAEELVKARPPDLRVRQASALLNAPGARLRDVERAVGLGERQLRRRFDAAVGYGPKTLQRIMRFRRFLASLDTAEGRPDLARLAFENGFADQSHLSRETTRLAGLSPSALARLGAAIVGSSQD
jgi:AraC-like DNA-binding protein